MQCGDPKTTARRQQAERAAELARERYLKDHNGDRYKGQGAAQAAREAYNSVFEGEEKVNPYIRTDKEQADAAAKLAKENYLKEHNGERFKEQGATQASRNARESVFEEAKTRRHEASDKLCERTVTTEYDTQGNTVKRIKYADGREQVNIWHKGADGKAEIIASTMNEGGKLKGLLG